MNKYKVKINEHGRITFDTITANSLFEAVQSAHNLYVEPGVELISATRIKK